MKQLLCIALVSILFFSCTKEKETTNYIGKWTEVKKTGNDFVIVNCGYEGENLTIYADSIFVHGTMEDYTMPLDHISQAKNTTQLYSDKDEKAYYSFTWEDKSRGIAKFELRQEGIPEITKYYVNSDKLKTIKVVKGTSVDCITSEDEDEKEVIEDDIMKPDFTTKDGTTAIKIVRDNCIEVYDVKVDTTLLDKCFKDVIVQTRPVSSNVLPLTFISGKHFMDVDFYREGNNWIAKEIKLFNPATGNEQGETKQFTISLKDFDYSTVLEKTETPVTE